MANVWVGDNYYITEIHEENIDVDGVSTLDQIYVKLQRLPESSHVSSTDIQIDVGTDNPDKFPSGLSKDDYLANVLPLVNSQITAYDAESNPLDTDTFDTSTFTLKY